jgi:catechol 2,3-dioxygenase-like lactoylglutathione lyase family enzyme
MIKGLAHVCLIAKDVEAMKRFYCDALGLKKTFDFIRDDRVTGFYVELSQGCYLEIREHNEIDHEAISPVHHFCLEVNNIDEIIQRLADKGYEATEKQLGADNAWQIWVTDPSGIRFEFHQYTDKSCQVTHENCILG